MTRLHLVCKGLVMVTATNETGRETVVHLVGVGGLLNATDIFLDSPTHSMSGVAVGESTIALVKPDLLTGTLQTNPSLIKQCLRLFSTQMHILEERFCHLQFHDVDTRMVHTILQLVHICGLEGEKKVIFPFRLKRSVLAQIVGATPETVSRVMARLRKGGLVLQSDRQMIIPDLDRLREALPSGG